MTLCVNLAGFIFLPKVLEKEHSLTVQEQMKKIVNCLYKVDIKTQPLSQIAKNHGLLTEADVQDIGTECLNQEEKAALIVLIDRIVTPPPDEWYDEFLTCLCEAGHQEDVKRMKQDSIPQGDRSVIDICFSSFKSFWQFILCRI